MASKPACAAASQRQISLNAPARARAHNPPGMERRVDVAEVDGFVADVMAQHLQIVAAEQAVVLRHDFQRSSVHLAWNRG